MKKTESRLLSKMEAAERLGVSVMTLHRMVQRGELHPIKIGRLVKFEAVKVDTYITERKVSE